MKMKYDVAVLGAGPGGYVAAIRLAQLGKKTVLIEKDKIGGTCLNRGCIPTKALLHSAEVYHSALQAAEFGVEVHNVNYDYSKITRRKDKVVKTLRNGIEYLLKNTGVDVILGEGILISKNEILINSEYVIEVSDIVLATGSRPADVPILGINSEGVLNSKDILQMTEIPESIIIIGGGVIGIEFATLFSTLGKKVTIIEMLPQILTGVDKQIANKMEKLLSRRDIEIHTSAKVSKIEKKDKLYCTYQKDEQEFAAYGEVCIIAVGRKPNTENIGLEKVGIKITKNYIDVNDNMQTSVNNIYAIGDITGKAQLAHVASAQGIAAAHNIAGQQKKMDYNIIPACIYTNPEIAYVGLDEDTAKKQGYDVKMGRFLVSANGKSMIMGEKDGVVKIVSDKKTGEILGAQMMSPRATDMIAEICAVMKSEGTVEELEDTIHPHPTISEMIMEAAHDVSGLSIHQA